MKNSESTTKEPALTGTFADIFDLFRSASLLHGRPVHGSVRTLDHQKVRTNDARDSVVNELDTLLRSSAARYRRIEQEARSLLGEDVQLTRVFPVLRRRDTGHKGDADADGVMAAMVSLFGRVSAEHGPVVVPLVGRVEAGTIALYEPYVLGFHPTSARTSIGSINGDWVRRRPDGNAGTPDIALDLVYSHGDAEPQAIVELTWVGDPATASGGTNWTPAPVIFGGETIALRLTSETMYPVNRWIKIPLTLRTSAPLSARYDVWLRTSADAQPSPLDDDDPPIEISTTPLPVPVPSPTPTGMPTDFLAALDPDRWGQIEDRLGQFVRDTIGAFEGVLSRFDILTDRAVLRDVSAALRERVRG